MGEGAHTELGTEPRLRAGRWRACTSHVGRAGKVARSGDPGTSTSGARQAMRSSLVCSRFTGRERRAHEAARAHPPRRPAGSRHFPTPVVSRIAARCALLRPLSRPPTTTGRRAVSSGGWVWDHAVPLVPSIATSRPATRARRRLVIVCHSRRDGHSRCSTSWHRSLPFGATRPTSGLPGCPSVRWTTVGRRPTDPPDTSRGH